MARMAAARMLSQLEPWAWTAVQIPLHYLERGTHLAEAALAGARRFEYLRHYPARDMIDPRHGTRAFYHTHDAAQRWDNGVDEHGHFHLFWDGVGDQPYVHLVALALDNRGQPLRWFCTNRWVTGGHWEAAPTQIERLPHFRLQVRGRLAPIATWLTAMVQLFADELARLLRARDRRVATLQRRAGADDLFEDRRVDVLCSTDAALAPRLAALGLA
jgi:hypothetical protein